MTLVHRGLGVQSAWVNGINDAGATVGVVRTYEHHAVRWDPDGHIVYLNPPSTRGDGTYDTNAFGINNKGFIVGYAEAFADDGKSSIGHRAVRWDPAGNPTFLDTLAPTGTRTIDIAVAINDEGIAVGYQYPDLSSVRAVRWDSDGGATFLKTGLGADPNGRDSTRALAVNSAGVIVGRAPEYIDGIFKGSRAIIWDDQARPTVLQDLPPSDGTNPDSLANYINDAGVVVGRSAHRAVMWEPEGNLTDLNTVFDDPDHWTLQNALGVNSSGYIVGTGRYDPDGPGPLIPLSRAFILTPVPEPMSLLPISCLAALIVGRQRKTRL